MHRNFSLWHWRWDIPAATVASHVSGTSRPETTRTRRDTKWLTLAHTHSWCSRWLAITRTPSVNSHRLWCHYTLSSQRGSAISPLMTMIHFVWSDNSIYTPANDREWKSERMIAAYVGATASMPTHSGHNTHTHTNYPVVLSLSIHTPVLSICALYTASNELVTPTVLQALGLYGRQAQCT